MIFESIYDDILASFGSLWKYKVRDRSLEIITPFATTTQKFVSVFLTERDGEYILTDGGWIHEGQYENIFDTKVDCFEKLLLYYQSAFNIKEVKNKSGAIIFYKKTDKPKAIPSIVLDVANFVSSIISASSAPWSRETEEESKVFKNKVNSYLREIINIRDDYQLDTLGYLGNNRMIRFNAIVTSPRNKLYVINYISGNNSYQFTNSIARAHLMFGMADKSPFRKAINKKISVVNDESIGYREDSTRLEFAIEDTKSAKVNWRDKESLQSILN